MGFVSSKRLTQLLITERDAVRVFEVLRDKANEEKGLTPEEVFFLCSIFLDQEREVK